MSTLSFYKAKAHKVVQEYKSALRNCHLPYVWLLMGRQGGCTERDKGGGKGKGADEGPDLTIRLPRGERLRLPDLEVRSQRRLC